MANAQTVVRNGVFSNMYIGINGGVNTGTVTAPIANFIVPIDFKTLPYNAALEIGKDVTPVTGFSLEGVANPNFNNGFGIDALDVMGNTKFNLMNLFAGYKGYPRRVEVRTVTGIGWTHNFNSPNPNDFSAQAGLEFDFNLGRNRNWYVTFTPMVQAHNILQAQQITYGVNDADLKANIGIAYRLGRGDSHNFEICPYTYTDEEYEILYGMYDECMSRPVETKIDTVIVEKIVEVENTVEGNPVEGNPVEGNDINGVLNFITFEKGSYQISNVQMQTLDLIMKSLNKDAKIKVIGSADTKTGSEDFNKDLAIKRAETVKAVLEKNGFTVTETTIKLDAFDGDEISRCAIITCK
jgi:hypothetical protein